MARPSDILDEREAIKQPLMGSIALHMAVLGGMTLLAFLSTRTRESWGDPTSLGGGVVGITPVKQLPLMATQGPQNPVAADTESQIPTPPPEPQAKPTVKEEPDAVPIPSQSKKTKPQPEPPKYDARKMPKREPQENQLTSRAGQAASYR